jgi:type 1 fimbria pilin
MELHMPRRPILVSSAFAATLLTLCCAAAAQSGMIRFTGMIVEPPCAFSLSAAQPDRPQLRPECPRPVSGNVAIVDLDSQKTLRTVRFSEASAPFALPAGSHETERHLIAVVTYE